MGRWPSAHGQPTKIGPSDGCKGEAVHLAVDQWYDFHGFGCHLGNVGLEALAKGIIVRANLIIGFPGETPCEVYQTMLCVFKLVIKGVDEVSTNLFSPYPGSKLLEELYAVEQIELHDE